MKISKLVCAVLGVLLLFGCGNDDSNGDAQNHNYDYYITGKANGQPFAYGVNLNSTSIAYVPSNSSGQSLDIPNNLCTYSYEPGFYENSFVENMLTVGFNFNKFYQAGCSQEDEFNAFHGLFPVGDYTYAANSSTKGVEYDYSPSGEDKFYTTFNGDQSNSSFKITSSTEANKQTITGYTKHHQIVEGSFNCTLYNSNDPTDKIEITEARFRVHISAVKQ